MENQQIKELIKKANSASEFSYSPYSNYKVGAALLTKSGKIFTGTNIENASYPAGICAERVALSKAVSEGESEFETIVIFAKDEQNLPYPCGICRQSLSEFSPNMNIVVVNNENQYETHLLSELFTHSFTLKK